MGNINKFVNKQLWRIKQVFLVFQPFILVIQLLLWIVITIGVTNWFELSFEMFLFITFITFIIMNIAGYVLDKKGFFLIHKTEEFRIAYPDMWVAQVKISAAFIAQYLKMPEGEINDLIKKNMKVLGIDEKTIEESIRKKNNA